MQTQLELEELSLKELSVKLVVLLALTLAARGTEIRSLVGHCNCVEYDFALRFLRLHFAGQF